MCKAWDLQSLGLAKPGTCYLAAHAGETSSLPDLGSDMIGFLQKLRIHNIGLNKEAGTEDTLVETKVRTSKIGVHQQL